MKRTTLLLLLGSGVASASEPTVESIDYATPSKYLKIEDSLGTPARISALTSELKAGSELKTIENVLGWMDRSLDYDGDRAYAWRNFDDVLEEKTYGGCADEGIFCGVLLKKSGIPTVWVKTMDVAWIREFKSGRPFKTWSGHVFLEVYVNGRWMLLDPGAKTIYKNYSPKTRLLPGDRFAYHKGDDPKRMVMSLQWEKWKEQTKRYFSSLDESLLPVDPTAGVLLAPSQAFVIGNSPGYKKLGEMARENGFTVRKSFNAEYDRHLPAAKGHLLLIETHGRKPIVPRKVLEKYFPNAFKGLDEPGGTVKIDGTDIVFFDLDDKASRLTIKATGGAE